MLVYHIANLQSLIQCTKFILLSIGGKSLQEMRNFYFTIKNEVFGGGIAGTFINMNQKSKKLEKILKDGFGKEMKMSDVTHPR